MAAAEAPSPALRAVAAEGAACCFMPASPLDPGTHAHAAAPGCVPSAVLTRSGQAAASAAAAAAALLLSPSVSVATPAATTAHAASTPAAAAQQAAEDGAVHAAATRDASASPEPGAGAQLAGAAVPAVPADDAALVAQHVQSFVRCVARSPLVQSALLSVEVAAAHPPCQLSGDCQLSAAAPAPATSAASSLEHTLAQLLALHLKADHPQAACESSLLAALWVLEAQHSADRSLATTCLESYLRLLALFSEELVVRITADWPGSFRKLRAVLVSAQADLLERLDWRVCLSYEEHVAPAHAWLFGQPTAGAAGSAGGAGALADTAPWVAAVRSVCTNIRQQAAVFRRCQARDHARAQARESTPEQGASEARPAKRQRAQQA